MRPIRTALRFVLRPLVRFIVRRMPVYDPWERVTDWLDLRDIAAGCQHPFSWYLEGASTVHVNGIDDICDWLAGCEYKSDPDLFNEPDFWQHPVTFEHLRKGDCEDFALWAWRKLLELKVDARFVVGSWIADGGKEWGQHAWVEYIADGVHMHLEPVRRGRDQMVRPLAEVRDCYVPQYTVPPSLKPEANAGLFLYWRHRYERERAEAAARRSQAA
jgi:hypothetical protein